MPPPEYPDLAEPLRYQLRRRGDGDDAQQPGDARKLKDLGALETGDQEPGRGEHHDGEVEHAGAGAEVPPDVAHVHEQVDDEDRPRHDVDRDRDARVGRRARKGDDDRQDGREHKW
jgi:hypothetical protein